MLLGWRFLAAELAGGLLMVAILAALLRLTLRSGLVDDARRQAEKGLPGRMEGHGEMDMSVTDGPFLGRLFSARAFTSISQYCRATELVFQALGLVPAHRPVAVLESHPEWNAATFLDIAFLALAALLGWRFLRTGGLAMLRMMSAPPLRQ